MNRCRSFLLGAVCLVGLVQPLATAEDFRIDTRIFINDEAQPYSENTTLFHSGVVYDILAKPAEITIYDSAHGKFTRLDPEGKSKVELFANDIGTFVEKLRGEAAQSDKPLLRFLGDPKFAEQWSPQGNVLTMASPLVTYRLRTIPCRSEAVCRQYAEFSNAYAQFNTVTNPASLPPFARMAINAALQRRSVLPAEVTLTLVTQPKPEKKMNYRSQHEVRWRLSDSDLARINEIADLSGSFRQVEQAGFNQPAEKPTAQQRPAAKRR